MGVDDKQVLRKETLLARDMTDPSWFSEDYTEARDRFRHLVHENGGRIESLPLETTGPNGETLTIDLGWFGAERPEKVLLHSSGVHGVEGFAGSAIQLSAIASQRYLSPDGGATIFVHVVNPYGMAWLRRVNENNVDLNRNFMPSEVAYEGAAAGYVAMNSVLNPQTPSRFDFFLIRAGIKIIRHGYTSLKQAVTGGQYEYPRGLFYGGAQLEKGPRDYLSWLAEHLGHTQRVFAIDIHTGLGRNGEDTLLVEADKTDPLYGALHTTFGDRVAPWDPDQSVAYAISGGYLTALSRVLAQAHVESLTQEFGTFPPLRVLHALREENRCHHYGKPDLSGVGKQRLLKTFYPQDDRWRRRILTRGHALLLQAHQRIFGVDSGHD